MSLPLLPSATATLRNRLRHAALAIALFSASMMPAWAEPAGDWQTMQPQTEDLTAEGVDYEIVYKPRMRVTSLSPDRNRVDLDADGDLTDLQAKLPEIARAALDKRNASASIKLNLVEMSPLVIQEPDIYVTGVVHAAMPLPGLSIPGLGNLPEKIEETFDVALRLYPEVGEKSLKLGTELQALTPRSNALAGFGLTGNSTQMVGQALLSALKADQLALTLPEYYERLDPKVTKAVFTDLGDQQLGIEASAEATLSDSELNQLRQTLASR